MKTLVLPHLPVAPCVLFVAPCEERASIIFVAAL